MRILLSNDDGIHAEGLRVMYRFLKPVAQVWVVAPLEEKSTTGHSLTLHKPLRMLKMDEFFYGVSGSPADCVSLGVREVMKRKKPDLVISGINRGGNLGQDIYYSGTVSAAREACTMGIPAIAVSLAIDFKMGKSENQLHYATAARVVVQELKKLQSHPIPDHTLLNINVPDLPYSRLKGVLPARQGFRHYSGSILRRTDHRGKDYYWIGGQYIGFRREKHADCDVVDRGYASITPMKLDATDYDFLSILFEEQGGPAMSHELKKRR